MKYVTYIERSFCLEFVTFKTRHNQTSYELNYNINTVKYHAYLRNENYVT
jgi:hypothetical protein